MHAVGGLRWNSDRAALRTSFGTTVSTFTHDTTVPMRGVLVRWSAPPWSAHPPGNCPRSQSSSALRRPGLNHHLSRGSTGSHQPPGPTGQRRRRDRHGPRLALPHRPMRSRYLCALGPIQRLSVFCLSRPNLLGLGAWSDRLTLRGPVPPLVHTPVWLFYMVPSRVLFTGRALIRPHLQEVRQFRHRRFTFCSIVEQAYILPTPKINNKGI
jgi:hypothetical protein